MAAVDIKKGLAGVVVDYTAVSKVNPDTNSLLYRGYPVQELAAKCSFEEVAYLLWNGELPTDAELAEFTARERAGRALDPVVKSGGGFLAHHRPSHGRVPHGSIRARRPARVGRGFITRSEHGEGNRPLGCHARRGRLRPAAPPRPGAWWNPARTWTTRQTSCG